MKHKWDDAARYIEEALKLYPSYSEALVFRSLLERDSHPEQALADTQKAVEYDPNYGMGYVALGSAYTRLGRFDDAIHSLDRGIVLSPSAWQGYFEMGRALIGKQNFLAALRHIEKACALVPKSYPFLHLAKADIFVGLKNHPAAIAELEAYIKEEPDGEKSMQARQTLDRLRATSSPTGSDSWPGAQQR